MSAHALVIIPTYNEAENVNRVVKGIFDQALPLDVLVVDDASPDGTGDVVEAVSREGENDASSLSALAGIMTYSLANHLSPLLPRVYLRGGKPAALIEPRLVG